MDFWAMAVIGGCLPYVLPYIWWLASCESASITASLGRLLPLVRDTPFRGPLSTRAPEVTGAHTYYRLIVVEM